MSVSGVSSSSVAAVQRAQVASPKDADGDGDGDGTKPSTKPTVSTPPPVVAQGKIDTYA